MVNCDLAMLNNSNVEEGDRNVIELNLELSIGRRYYSENLKPTIEKKWIKSCAKLDSQNFLTYVRSQNLNARNVDPELDTKRWELDTKRWKSKPEIHKEWLEAHIRVRDREMCKDEDVLMKEPPEKKQRVGIDRENCGRDELECQNHDLNLVVSSSIPVVPVQCHGNGFENPVLMPLWVPFKVEGEGKSGNFASQPAACQSVRPYRGIWDVERDDHHQKGGENGKANSNGSPGCSSSSLSDYQCSSGRQDGNTDDGKSNSSHRRLEQQITSSSATSGLPEESEHSSSSKQIESNRPIPKITNHDASKEANGIMGKPASVQQVENHETELLHQMPCVSTTGNGPNGKTITGFLYSYSEGEVIIVCVCHGRSFSPAEFVEHAGGRDITHPLRHITVVPFDFS